MAKDIIFNFRPTPEAKSIIEAFLDEGYNKSQFINEAIINYNHSKTVEKYTAVYSTIPEGSISMYGGKLGIEANIKLYTRPLYDLSLKKLKEAIEIIKTNGLDYFRFQIDDETSVSLISSCEEEARIKLQQYFFYDKDKKTYYRTSRPLPQIRYDLKDKNVIVINYE